MKKGNLKHMRKEEEDSRDILIRIYSTDIPANHTIYAGLTKIKGVSWAFSNALCHVMGLDKTRKVAKFSKAELEKISEFLANPKVPEWLLNRRNDRETGVSKHNITNDLDISKEWDIRRLKKIKSYKGWRHALGQPVRGQRTKGHFRQKGKAVGVRAKKGGTK